MSDATVIVLQAIADDPQGYCERNGIDIEDLYRAICAAQSALLASLF
jgi:hypothetical protein